MFRLRFLLAPLLCVLLSSCSTVPITGREQFSLVPDESIIGTSRQQYRQFLQQARVIEGTPQSQMVKDVGQRIAAAVERFLAEQGQGGQAASYEWEFNLVDDPEVNAWAMPGGKVAVYRGLLGVADTPSQLAAVMGHEVAHVVARHGNERLSQGLLAQMGGMALSAALTNRPQQTQELWMKAFGAGTQLGVILPFSRLQEREADRLGLIFMAMAGYDPNSALTVWEKMAQRSGGGSVPGFLSTHPTDRQRIEEIRSHLPEAMRYYRPA